MVDINDSVKDALSLLDKTVVITGGAGLLGIQHGLAVAEFGGNPILIDLDEKKAKEAAHHINAEFNVKAKGLSVDITNEIDVRGVKDSIVDEYGGVDVLINNAANNPTMSNGNSGNKDWTSVVNFPIEIWNQDISVGLTGAFLCSKYFGSEMANNGGGVILNISSDLGVIAPDQRIYRKEGEDKSTQSFKPVTYSVVKTGLIGLTKYLATYWTDEGVRVNALAPGGVYKEQDEKFVKKLTQLIPMGRMANQSEYKAAIVFMVSQASSYMTGSIVNMDGGRTVW